MKEDLTVTCWERCFCVCWYCFKIKFPPGLSWFYPCLQTLLFQDLNVRNILSRAENNLSITVVNAIALLCHCGSVNGKKRIKRQTSSWLQLDCRKAIFILLQVTLLVNIWSQNLKNVKRLLLCFPSDMSAFHSRMASPEQWGNSSSLTGLNKECQNREKGL